MKTLAIVFLSALFSVSAFAESVVGSCKLVNAAGLAQLTLTNQGGEISGATGSSPVHSIRTIESVGFVRMLEIEYTSRLAASHAGHETVRVVLAMVPSPATALMGVNFQGMIMLPLGVPALAFPGPFSYSGGGWLNPMAPFVPTVVPAGYAPIAAAYCNFR